MLRKALMAYVIISLVPSAEKMKKMKNTKKRVLSGIRATGQFHLGNYLGAVKGMRELQNNAEYETFYMVADVHVITTPYKVEELKRNRRGVILDFLAAGLDPEKSTFFIQSEVKEHTELAFYLSSLVNLSDMLRVPAYKEKLKEKGNTEKLALINYPILMAADILLYKAVRVPLGYDQEPHLEVARQIARELKKKYGVDLPEPKRHSAEVEKAVPSLLDSNRKMSKSVEGSYISLMDSIDKLESRLNSVVTDSGSGSAIPEEGGVVILLKLVEYFEGMAKRKEYEKQYLSDGISYAQLKKDLADAIYNGRDGLFKGLATFQERRKKFEKDTELVERILENGAEKARKIAAETLSEIKEKMGFV